MSNLKIALFRKHKNDPMSWAISALTRGGYTHAAILMDPILHLITEAFYPKVHQRLLTADEIQGIDFFDIAGLTYEQEAGIFKYCNEAIGDEAHYSISNLFRFFSFIRPFSGEAQDTGPGSSVFCSQFVIDAFERGAGFRLLRANSWEVAPSQLAWSPFLIPWSIEHHA